MLAAQGGNTFEDPCFHQAVGIEWEDLGRIFVSSSLLSPCVGGLDNHRGVRNIPLSFVG